MQLMFNVRDLVQFIFKIEQSTNNSFKLNQILNSSQWWVAGRRRGLHLAGCLQMFATIRGSY